MRLYLDTNILVFLLLERRRLSAETVSLLSDCCNALLTSSACVQELIYLCQAGRITRGKRERDALRAEDVLCKLAELGVRIVPVDERHLRRLSELPLLKEHHDPNDRIIIAQAIEDRTALVSSDHKFAEYEGCGLDFIFND